LENSIRCPKCKSTQITANKTGFSVGKAAAGILLTGGIGIAAGAIGKNKIIITCLSCGENFKPGEQLNENDNGSVKFISKEGISEPKLLWDITTKTYIQNPNYKEISIPWLAIAAFVMLIGFIYIIIRS
jgi:hypothetical protein